MGRKEEENIHDINNLSTGAQDKSREQKYNQSTHVEEVVWLKKRSKRRESNLMPIMDGTDLD